MGKVRIMLYDTGLKATPEENADVIAQPDNIDEEPPLEEGKSRRKSLNSEKLTACECGDEVKKVIKSESVARFRSTPEKCINNRMYELSIRFKRTSSIQG